jgi:hypothetical protein
MREIAEAKRVKQLEGPKGTVNDAASGAHPHDTGTPTSSGKTPDPVHAPTPGIPKGAEPTYGNGLSLGDIETQAVQKKPSYKGKDKLQPGEIAGDMPYKNKSSPKLPEVDTAGQTITYKEFDIKPYDGVNRGAERVVIGTDSLGNKTYYYTADHYSSWTQFEPKR